MVDRTAAGTVASGWESVGEVFAANFEASDGDPGDHGAGLCVIRDGDVVVDLWGGWRDRGRTVAFGPDTLVNAYSVGKGVTAITALIAVSRGLVDLDGPVRRWWPELEADTTLRQHLAHQAGLAALRQPADPDLPMDWSGMCSALAATEPWWEPGTAHGYHTNTFGFLVGEPVRRAAGAARFGDLVADWLAGPLEADLFFGVPDRDLGRCSDVLLGEGGAVSLPAPPAGFATELDRLRHHAYYNPPSLSGMGVVETRQWRQAEVPSTNLHATARAVARVYAGLLGDDSPVDPEVLAEAVTTQVEGEDVILGTPTRFGLGFQLHRDERPIGVTPRSFGHFGFGGSIGFADPDTGLAVGYVINRPGDRWQIPRTRRLLAALREVTGSTRMPR